MAVQGAVAAALFCLQTAVLVSAGRMKNALQSYPYLRGWYCQLRELPDGRLQPASCGGILLRKRVEFVLFTKELFSADIRC